MRLALGRPARRSAPPYVVLSVICTGIFIAALDQTVIYGALPDMMPDIRITVLEIDRAAWIVTGYLLGYTIALPLMGKVSDVYGHDRIYMLSIFIFMVGSIFAAVASNFSWMVGARVFQAIGGGAMVPVAMAIVGDIFPKRSRVIALGIIGGAVEGGAALGPFYGAALAHYLDWRWIFWINIPISLVALLLVYLLLEPSSRTKGKIDYIGGILLTGGLALLSVALSYEWRQQNYITYLVSFLVPALFLFALFLFREFKASAPIIEFSMFRDMTFSSAVTTNFFVGGSLIIALVNIPLMSDTIMGCSALEGGLRLLRLTIMISIGAVIGGFLCRISGYRPPTILGLILSSVGFFFMSRWPLDIADPEMTLHLVICGLGFGLVIAPLSTAVIDSVGEKRRGIASSLVVMTRMIGMIVGLCILTSWGMSHFHGITAEMSLSELMEYPETLINSLLAIFRDFFLASVGICLAAILPALWLKKRTKSASTSEPDSYSTHVAKR